MKKQSTIQNYFVAHGVLKENTASKALNIFLDLVPDITTVTYVSPQQFAISTWEEMISNYHTENLTGQLFELLLSAIFIREGLMPFYTAAEVELVPNVKFDFLFWTKERGPIVVSAKTSLRERYKQADLEAFALRAVYRKSRTYLITLDATEAVNVEKKIDEGEIANLDAIYVATEQDFNELILLLKEFKLIVAGTMPIMRGGNIVKS